MAPQPSTVSAPAVGAPAPDFALPSTAGTDVRLADFRGARQVLLAFFPLAFTSTCTAELCAWRHGEAELGHKRDDAELLRQIEGL